MKFCYFVFLCLPIFALATETKMAGGLQDVPIDDNIQGMVNRAVVKLNAESNNIYMVKLVEIIEAKSQVVAGVMYHIYARVGETTCTKTHMIENCPVRENADTHKCYFKIFQQPWKNFEEISYNCQRE